MKKLSLSILAVLLSVCLLFALSVQCAAAEVMGNPGMGENSAGENSAGDLNNGFIEGNPNNPNDGNNGSGFTPTTRTKAEMQTARTTVVSMGIPLTTMELRTVVLRTLTNPQLRRVKLPLRLTGTQKQAPASAGLCCWYGLSSLRR